ncbi:hypothetical protein SAMN03080615_03967 [Amphritea atlantica]|uniref:Uncharacterized protein n=1 Tax=Amphritea atlantica TaxID=355243 RepID=A0A1H9LI78_9GAMM|nr:hypothetical protein [Amphritea atlantica]SER11110.1 hypothetical protein SAMN03080615_03967 [Amphritea atlantica]
MIRSVRLIALSSIVVVAQLGSFNTVEYQDANARSGTVSSVVSYMSSDLTRDFSQYSQQPLWWQTSLFPRWNDTYVVVFEQKMLA